MVYEAELSILQYVLLPSDRVGIIVIILDTGCLMLDKKNDILSSIWYPASDFHYLLPYTTSMYHVLKESEDLDYEQAAIFKIYHFFIRLSCW